jgi:membrane protease YdiL (CAAX protease family)
MSARKIVMVALATQAALTLAAWWGGVAVGVPLQWGNPARDAALGAAAAVGLALVNYWLLTRARANWLVDGVRAVYHQTVLPLFGRLGPVSAIAIGAAAGIGEELLFRGLLQPLLGLAAASVLFGAAHVGGVRMLPFGVWATGMGVVMGTLAIATGGLTAPIVAHGLYDMLALEYIRRRPGGAFAAARPGAEIE